jgi:uncharacterized protein YdhG (YjbR/CyaY superfamily)
MRGKPKATTHDEYLAALPRDRRAALEELRSTIKAAAPEAEECMSYHLPTFRLGGKVLPVEAHEGDLKRYSTSKGTIRFDAEKSLPATLVRKIIKYRIAETAAQQQHAADGAARRR